MKKPLAATLIAATTLGGVAAGATVLGPGFAGAQDSTDPAPSTAPDFNGEKPDRGAHLTEALQPLVDDGTLTEDQVEAVVGALESARPERGQFPGQHSGQGQRGPGGPNLESLAEVLGTDAQSLGEQLRSGESLADIAAENGVDTDEIVDVIVDGIEERVQAGVDSGRIDQDKADEILADAETRAQDVIDGNVDPRGPRGPGGHRGPGGPGAPADGDTA